MLLKKLGYLALLGICGYSGYYLASTYQQPTPKQVAPDLEKPFFTAANVRAINYSQAGTRLHTLEAPFLEHYQARNETHFNEPLLHTFTQDQQKEWQVSSNFATLQGTNTLVMVGNVTMINLLPNAQIQTVTTDEITVDLNTRDFLSNSATKIIGHGFSSHANSAKGNFGSHNLQLTQQVQTIYDPKIN
ncbi:MAG: LPS export ABC transporter periplasmic protein LptC [Vibrionaceae bacterium]